MNTIELKDDDPITFGVNDANFQQNFALITFVYPEKQMKKKLLNDISKFIVYFVNKKFNEVISSVVAEYNIQITNEIDNLTSCFKDLNKDLKDSLLFSTSNTEAQRLFNFNDFKEILESLEFNDIVYNDQHIHGIKIGGVFATIAEANNYSQEIKKKLEPNIDCFVGKVGIWGPFNPASTNTIKDKTYDATRTKDVQYDQIMSGYAENTLQKDNFLMQQNDLEISKGRESELLKKIEEKKKSEEEKKKLEDKIKLLREQRKRK